MLSEVAAVNSVSVRLRPISSYFLNQAIGIATQYTIEAHPIGQVWGGIRIYDAANADQIYAALHAFTPSNVNDPKEAIILTNVDATASLTTILIFYFYDGPEPPTEGAFADFLAIPHILDTTKTQSYAELVSALPLVLESMLTLTS